MNYGLRWMYTNTEQLQNKLFELQNFCEEHKMDLMAITETLPKTNSHENESIKFILDGYIPLQNNIGRGYVFFIKIV